MEKSLRILHLEDNPTDVKLSEWALQEASIATEAYVVTTRAEFVAALAQPDFDLILSDYRLPGFDGLEALALAREQCPQLPFIFVTGTMGEDLAIESLKSGATDYVLKQKLSRLAPAVQRAVSEAQERQERARAEATSRQSDIRFRTLFEQFPFSLQILAPDGHTLRVNQAWEQLWNLCLEDLAAYNMLRDSQLADKGILPYIQRAFAGAASAIPAICYEPAESLSYVSSYARWVEAFVCPMKDDTGRVTEVVLMHRDVTDERQTEAALRLSESRLRALAEANLIGIVFSDSDGNINDANDAFLKLIGYSRAELQAGRLRWTELTPPEFLHLDARGIEEAKAQGSCTPYEKVYIRKDGSQVPILIGYVLMGEKDHIAFILDLTDLKRANQALQIERAQARASEQKYRFLAESIPQMVWTALPDGGMDYFNQRWVAYTGLALTQSQEWGWEAAAHPDDLARCRESWQRAKASGQPWQLEIRLKRLTDGAYRWHLGRAEPLRDDNGAVVKWFGTYTDIDDRKRNEETMRFLAAATTLLASSLDYEATLQRVAQLAVPSLADWCMVDILENGKLRRAAIAHQDPAQTEIAQKLQHQYPPRQDLSFGAHHVARTGQSEIVGDMTALLLHAAAQDEMHLALLQEAGFKSYMCVPLIARGRVLGVISFVATQAKRAYQSQDLALAEELARSVAQAGDNALLYRTAQQARDAAEEASRAKDEFLATLSHELRTPLNAIMGWVSLLRTGRLDAATSAQALETVERNTRVQTQLVEDILDMSRIITGKLHLESRPVALAAVIEAASNAVRPAAEAKGVSLHAMLDFGLGPVAGDAHRLQQVVWNLLANAIKFTPRGGSVEIRLERLASHVTIIVSDTGIGISADFQPYIFDRFRQADSSSTREYGGLGLGLAIVRHLVELHGGWTEVASPGLGQGAIFTVHLPLMAVHPTEFPAPPETPRPTSDIASTELAEPFQCPPELAGLRILVVDDENDARLLITHVLEQCNATVQAVASVTAALEVLPQFKPDVVVSDIGMPNEDGYSLIRKIRALSPEQGGRVPAAALTAYARSEDRTRALAAGYQMHLPKPVEPGELALVVASLVGRKV